MALVNKVWRESMFVPPGAEPGLIADCPFMENVQDNAVQDIAKTRFGYPSKARPDLKTHANRPEHTVGVRSVAGDLLFPDIVVMDASTTEVEMLGEVETQRSLGATDLLDKWRAFIGVGRLYIFVPLTHLDHARSLVRQLDTRPAGLRSWKYNMGQGRIEVLEMPF